MATPSAKSKVPRHFAIAGIIIGFSFMMTSWYINRFDPFHLPTAAEAANMGSVSEPPLLSLFEDLTFVFCPAAFLFFFTMDLGATTNYIVWAVVALINAPIYYGAGAILVVLAKLRSRA